MNGSDQRPGDPGYVRTLGGAEQGLDAMESGGGECHIVRVITFDGALDTELFERALHHLLQRRPLLTTGIARPPGEAPFFYRRKEEEWPKITFVERRDAQHWRAEFERQLSTALRVDGDGLFRLTALTGERNGEIILSCHHAVCDGRSLTMFCRDLAHEYESLLRGLPGDPAAVVGAVPPPLEDLLPPGLTGSSGERVMEEYLSRLTALMTSPPGFFLEFEPDPPPGRHLLTYELPPATAEALHNVAHANGTTIGGAISAAILRAGLDLAGPGVEDTVGLTSNLDLRSHLRENVPVANMGMYAASSFGAYDGIRTKPFWTVAREVTEEIQSSIDSLQPYCSTMLSKWSYEAHRDGVLPKVWPQFMLANLGRMELPEPHEAFRVKTIHGGTPIFGNGAYLFCTVVGLAGSILVDVNYRTPVTPNQVARDFGASLMERLVIESGSAAAQSAQR